MIGFRSQVSGFRLPALLLAAVLAGHAAAGETPQVVARASASEIYLGDIVDYQVQLQHARNPVPPDMAAFAADFDVVAAGDRSLNQVSTFIVNGRMSKQESYGHVYAYRLTPKRAGDLTVPAPTVTLDGRVVTGHALALRVIAPEKQDLVLMEIVTKPAKVFPTQPFDVTLRILIKPLPDVRNRDPLLPLCQAGQPPALQINWDNAPQGLAAEERNEWLQKYLANSRYGFALNGLITSRFLTEYLLFNLSAGRETRRAPDGSKTDYFLYELKRTFTPKQPGTYTFGPATLKGSIIDGSTGRQYTVRAVLAVAPQQAVEVRTVPTLRRPASFCGGVGAYKASATAAPTTLRVGDPLTLTLTIERQASRGVLDLVSAPDLSANAELAGNFDIIDKAPTGEVKGDAKSFAYGLRPKRIVAAIPQLTVTTFNPETERFVDVTTEPIKLNVTESSQLKAGELVGTLPGNQAHELRSRQEGIYQNLTDVADVGDQAVRPAAYLIAAVLLWVFYGCLSLAVTRWRRQAGDTAWQRRQRARSAANHGLNEARAAAARGGKEEAARSVRAAVAGLIGDMLNLSAAGMTARGDQPSKTSLIMSKPSSGGSATRKAARGCLLFWSWLTKTSAPSSSRPSHTTRGTK
ncbi:MAG: BatD family protein [Planctomycetota bacterium]|nr:BatD family protein [Planctomycetota bacterium]